MDINIIVDKKGMPPLFNGDFEIKLTILITVSEGHTQRA